MDVVVEVVAKELASLRNVQGELLDELVLERGVELEHNTTVASSRCVVDVSPGDRGDVGVNDVLEGEDRTVEDRHGNTSGGGTIGRNLVSAVQVRVHVVSSVELATDDARAAGSGVNVEVEVAVEELGNGGVSRVGPGEGLLEVVVERDGEWEDDVSVDARGTVVEVGSGGADHIVGNGAEELVGASELAESSRELAIGGHARGDFLAGVTQGSEGHLWTTCQLRPRAVLQRHNNESNRQVKREKETASDGERNSASHDDKRKEAEW